MYASKITLISLVSAGSKIIYVKWFDLDGLKWWHWPWKTYVLRPIYQVVGGGPTHFIRLAGPFLNYVGIIFHFFDPSHLVANNHWQMIASRKGKTSKKFAWVHLSLKIKLLQVFKNFEIIYHSVFFQPKQKIPKVLWIFLSKGVIGDLELVEKNHP